MFNGRSIEFFQGESGTLSMTRLLCFLSFFPASYVVIIAKTENILGWYLGAYVLSYVGGKTADVLSKPQPPSLKVQTKEGDVNVTQGNMEAGSKV